MASLVLTTALAVPALSQGSDLDAAWRKVFRRETTIPAPPASPITPEKIRLGAKLFADKRLSGTGTRGCIDCHQPVRSFTDGRKQPLSLTGAPLVRNTPALWNLAWSKLYFWDGRASSLEEQVAMPIENADEMAGDWPNILDRLNSDPQIVGEFRSAFPDRASPVEKCSVVDALAAYVRSLVAPRSRFDEWVDGQDAALGPHELRGFRLFTGRAGCVLCHVGWRFTDDRFHDIGLRSTDPGRGAVPGGTTGLRAFKTPTLRELARTAPYMHDGSLPTLAAVVQHYAGGRVLRPSLSTHINRSLRLTAKEKADLIAFLLTLSSEP